jgi:hypothetical protein
MRKGRTQMKETQHTEAGRVGDRRKKNTDEGNTTHRRREGW